MATIGGPTLEMLTGKPMPLVGLGTWLSKPGEVEDAVRHAVNAGYRHIDTARGYRNEGEIGNALEKVYNEGKVKREDLFITTKLTGAAGQPTRVKSQVDLSLKLLKTDYIDLLLIHFPVLFSDEKLDDDLPAFFPFNDAGEPMTSEIPPIEIYKEMEKLVDAGIVKALGLSNFNEEQVQIIWDNCKVKPSNLQCECHAWFQQEKLVNFCQEKGITFAAYGPIGSPGRPGLNSETPVLMKDPVVVRIAEEKKKTPAQVLLKYLMQRNIIVIPKSVSEHRIISNFEVFDFILSEKDMADLKAINKSERLFSFSFLGAKGMAHPQFPF